MSAAEKHKGLAVLLLAHGSPDSPEQVPEFLLRVTGGRELPPEVVGVDVLVPVPALARAGCTGEEGGEEDVVKDGAVLVPGVEL